MADKIFHLLPWTPKLAATANALINDIHSVAPELEVLFMGAGALELPGKNDIDLDVLCDVKDVPYYVQKLSTVLGKPKKVNDEIAFWEYVKDGFEIDCILSDPAISHVPQQRQRFEILKASSALWADYKALKLSCDGLPYDEYEKKKIAFFEKISKANH